MKKILKSFVAFTTTLLLFAYLLSAFSNWNLNPVDWVAPTRLGVFAVVCPIDIIGFIVIVISYSWENDTK